MIAKMSTFWWYILNSLIALSDVALSEAVSVLRWKTLAPAELATVAISLSSVDTQTSWKTKIQNYSYKTKMNIYINIICIRPQSLIVSNDLWRSVVFCISAKFFFGIPLLPPRARIKATTWGL